MTFNQKFLTHLLNCLKNKNYVLFEHFIVHHSPPEIPLNFLLSKSEHPALIEAIQNFSGIGIINNFKQKNCTELRITFQDETKMEINIWHRLAKQDMVYLNANEVLSKKQRSKSEFFMPNIEHLFEFSILHFFLNGKGLAMPYHSYFEDFHFFVKDGLLDFFNEKYLTKFSNLDDLTVFDLKKKAVIIEELKKRPSNQFFKKINFQWQNFWRASNL